MEELPVSVPRFLPVIFGTLMLLTAQPGLAKTYKWVDENGVTQYTQTPPPKGDYESVKPPPKPAIHPEEAKKQLLERVEAYDERRTDAQKSQEEADKKQAETDKKASDCEKSKQNLSYFESKTRIKQKDKDGNVVLLPEEERQKKIQKMREDIKKLCN